MPDFGLDDKTIQTINNFFASIPEISEVRIFGSRAKGNFKPSSDIDFAVYGKITPKLLRHITFELEELPTPYCFDVVDYNDINNENLKKSIDENSKLFFKR